MHVNGLHRPDEQHHYDAEHRHYPAPTALIVAHPLHSMCFLILPLDAGC